MKRLFLVVVVLAVFALIWTPSAQKERTAIVDIGDGIVISMRLRPMFSLQSDWHRTLGLRSSSATLKTQLSEDTGWWRGSNLYRHEAGIYILDEGQGGFVSFTISPLKLVTTPKIFCTTSEVETENGAEPELAGEPSQFYCGVRYLGQFAETRRGDVAIRFIPASEAAEQELPEML